MSGGKLNGGNGVKRGFRAGNSVKGLIVVELGPCSPL